MRPNWSKLDNQAKKNLPHNLIKDLLVDLIERIFQRKGSLYIPCNDRNAFFTSDAVRNYNLWSCQKVCEALTFLLDNIYIRFGSKLYRQIVGIPMGPNCVPLVADLFSFCYERDFMLPLSEDNQSGVIEAFKSRKQTPQKLTQLSSRSHPRHLVGKRTAQKDIIDTTSDSQVNSNFPNRWSPASLTFNNYFYLFLYLYIT